MKAILISLILLFSSVSLQAKVFDLSNQSIGTFLRGSYGLASLQKTPFGDASGASTEFSDSFGANMGGEFGVYFASGLWGFRFSLESLAPKKLSAISGSNSSGTELMTLDSSVGASIAKLGVEYSFPIDPASKAFISFSLGSASVALANVYSLNSTGSSLYSPVVDHKEEASAQVIMGEIGFGYEYNFGADTTILLDIGYRSLKVLRLTHDKSITSFNPDSDSGDVVKNTDSTTRSIDLSGLWLGLGFRFYINL